MINIDQQSLASITALLKQHLSKDVQVYAFGSRVKNTSRKNSDLDLVLVSDTALAPAVLFSLKEAFEASDIPFRIDLSDWRLLSESFKPFIEKEKIRILF